MPLACDPTQTTDVNLPADDDAPEASRPTFTYRFLTVAEFFERQRRWDGIRAEGNEAAANDALTAALAVGLVGWRNVATPAGEAIPYKGNPAELDRVLTYGEKFALFARAGGAVSLGTAEKKSSGLPPSSEPAPSVASAAPPAAASTRRAARRRGAPPSASGATAPAAIPAAPPAPAATAGSGLPRARAT